MSYSMTYSSLLEDLRRYLERGFTEESDPLVFEQLPRLITLAERRISRDLKIEGFIRAIKCSLTPGVAVYLKPDRWRDTVSMTINRTPIFARSYEYLRNYWPIEEETAPPEFYADYDYQHWLLAPTPDTASELEILYYEQPRFLAEDFQTNWLTEYAPDILLYASLLEATPFLKADSRIPVWQGLYDNAKNALSAENMRRVLDRTATRSDA
jgi:hypothetical protein